MVRTCVLCVYAVGALVKYRECKFYAQYLILGAAGVVGALVYAALTFLTSPKASLLIQVFMPLVMLATYFFILGKPGKILPPSSKNTASLIQLFYPHVHRHSKADSNEEDDSKPLLGEATRNEERENDDIQINTRGMKLQFFNKEELGMYKKIYFFL